MPISYVTLPRNCNQALEIGRYAIDFLRNGRGEPSPVVLARVEQFHLDSIACAVSALATGCNAPWVLRREALSYRTADPLHGVPCLASKLPVFPEKAIAANCAAARELDSNGTNFGFNPRTGYTRGEFGHNDFYPVAVAAAQLAGWNGAQLLRAMLCLDEIRGRLAEVFGLKDYKVDHVVHGAIASAAVYGAVLGATAEQIESAIGMTVAHYIPFRAIRAGHQLSDSKGASAAISTEAAILSMQRAMRGFIGPADIFRNPQAIFCLFEPQQHKNASPFDLELAESGDDFAVMGMHFKLGLYEHQSAGAIEGLLSLLAANPAILAEEKSIRNIRITIYEPAFGIIGDPHKRDPRTRQSADHSMVYIIGTILRKAIESGKAGWRESMLVPADYDDAALFHPLTRSLMERIEFVHGGAEYDVRYPDGIPTTVEIELAQAGTAGTAVSTVSSGLVMYPHGHARHEGSELAALLANKFRALASAGVGDVEALLARFSNLAEKDAEEVRALFDFELSSPNPF